MSLPHRERRLHGVEGAPPLAHQALDGGGLERVECLLAQVDGLPRGVRVLVDRPHLETGAAPARPSLTLAVEPAFTPRAPDDADASVAFEWDGGVQRTQVAFPDGTSFYGGGLVACGLRRNGRTVTFWNTDAWRYGQENPSLYQSHPYVLAVLPDGSAAGVLADSPRRGLCLIADDGLELVFEGEPFDLYRFAAPHPAEVQRTLAALAGRMPLPPAWALGYHQSRWGWDSAEEVLAVARELRARDLPCDAVWLDIDHMDRGRSFTFDPERFPDPEGLLAELHALGFRVVAIVDPGLAVDPGYAPWAEALRDAHLVLDAAGAPVRGRVWPGVCGFPDFTREATRRWWAEHTARFAARGLDGIWNDMNEPALLRSPLRTLPDDARHAGLGGGTHGRFHNLYGRLMVQATREGLQQARPQRRPFVLTRANHLSGARFAATWTGDNQATWEDLRLSIPMVLSLGLSGQPFSGPDLGGFDGDPDPELYARWFELGALLPFARGHSSKAACRKEPWAFGPQVEARVRAALALRLRLLPTLYTLFHAAATDGLPVARPLFFADPGDERLRAVDDAWLLGADLLVAPIVEPGTDRRRVELPSGGWYPFAGSAGLTRETSLEAVAAPGAPPLFARAGSIVVSAPDLASAAALPGAALELLVFPDASGDASGSLWLDDGESTASDGERLRLSARTTRGRTVVVLEREGPSEAALPALRATVRAAPGGDAPAEVRVVPRR